MRRETITPLVFFSVGLLCFGQSPNQPHPYAAPNPMPAPALFGEGIISTGDFDSHPAFTPDGGSDHRTGPARERQTELSAATVDFTQAEHMLALLRAHATGSVTNEHVELVLRERGTELIIRQQNISRHVTRELYEQLLRSIAVEPPATVAPADSGVRVRRGIEGLVRDVTPSLRWGIQNTALLAERLEALRQIMDPGRALALARSLFTEKPKVSPRFYVVMGGRAGATALEGGEIYFDLLATSYYAQRGTLANFPTPEQVTEFFAHEVHHLLMAAQGERLTARLSLSTREKIALSFLTSLASEGGATYLINEHGSEKELRADPQFTDYLSRTTELRSASEEIPRRVLEEGLAGEAYEHSLAPLSGSGWHAMGSLLFSVIDRAEGLEGVFEVLRDPRLLYVAYNRSAKEVAPDSVPFPPFPDSLSHELAKLGEPVPNQATRTKPDRARSYASEQLIPQPVIFGEGIISTGDYESHPAFTPDGRTLYFVKSTPTFSFWTIVVSHFVEGQWTTPKVAPFSGRYSDADPFITADGKQLYFISRRPAPGKTTPDLDIWVMDSTGAAWIEPYNLGAPVNSRGNEWYPTVAADGTMYFGSDRPGGKGATDIYRSRLVNGKYQEPENLGEAINTAFDEYEPYIAPDQSYLIFMASGRPDGRGGNDLYISFFKDGSWTKAQNLGEQINSPRDEYSPKVSPDGKYFFFAGTRGRRPPEKQMNYDELLAWLRGPRNGLGDIYQVDFGSLRTPDPER